MPIDTHLGVELDKMDKKYGGDNMYKMMGPTLLSYSSTDSSRMYMFTSHLKQFLVLREPDVPRLQTGFEKLIGEYGKYNGVFKEVKGDWEVEDVIRKFNDSSMYTVVLYNKKTKTYDMIERPVAENLTEKFGYLYNTSVIDALKPGDKVRDGDILYKSTSYDKDMNYRYGKNARVFYSVSTDTLEDAITVRRGWANTVISDEVDYVDISINDNDILLNLYGNKDEEYKPLPDIGETVKNSTLCATRRINKNHILYDFQTDNLKNAYDTDTEYFVSKDSIVYDIDVHYNGDDPFPDNIFNKQLKYYRDCGLEYARKIKEWCDKIDKSGCNKTDNVEFYQNKYMHYDDPEYKFAMKDKPFGYMFVRVYVHAPAPLEPGAKGTGRYGNKGVMSQFIEDAPIDGQFKDVTIIDDERMPYYYNPITGEKVVVDVILNMSGAVRRLDPEQLVEVEVNFIAEMIQSKVKTLKTREEKAELIFKFLEMVNSDMAFFKDMYDGFDYTKSIDGRKFRFMKPGAQDAFIQDVEENGFYLVRPPHQPLLYDDIKRLYDEFPWIKPVDMYVNLFGIKDRKMTRKGVVGWEYMLILKQTSRKNFSARSTYRISRANMPAKDSAKKNNKSAYAKTPVRLSEIYALMPSISGRDLAEYNIFMRSSAIGRKSLKRILEADGNPFDIKKLSIRDNFINSNAEILNARLKAIGLRINFVRDGEEGKMDVYTDQIIPMHIKGLTVYATYDKYDDYVRLFDLYEARMREFSMVETYYGEKSDTTWDYLANESEEAKELIERIGLDNADISMLKATCVTHLSNELSKVSGKRKVVESNETEDSETQEVKLPKKRGRKPKVKPEESEE